MTDYVLGFYFVGDDRVLLIEKKRPVWMHGMLNAIGGHLEEGEAPLDAVVREFQEETGVHVSSERWVSFTRLWGDGFHVWMYRADALQEDPLPVTKTDERVCWGYVGEIVMGGGDVVSNLRWLLPMARKDQSQDWVYYITEKGRAWPGNQSSKSGPNR